MAKDIAERLGYSNPRDAIYKHVDPEDKGVANCDTLGGNQGISIINESGLYSLVLSSKLPNAKKFKRWVTSEVLPAIRRTGGYIAAKADDTPEEIMARALLIANDTIQRQKSRSRPTARRSPTVMKSSAAKTRSSPRRLQRTMA